MLVGARASEAGVTKKSNRSDEVLFVFSYPAGSNSLLTAVEPNYAGKCTVHRDTGSRL